MGNIHAMIKASDGSIAAAYEYDNYGTTLRESGPYAASNPFRYSTKYTVVETGLVYYGQRYYSPSLGRFINQDPIQETGGLNLYAFCGNNGVNRWDYLGMKTITYKIKRYNTNGTTQTSNKPAAETYTSNTTEYEDEVTVEVPDEPIDRRVDLEGNGGDPFENLFLYGDPHGLTQTLTLTDPGSGSRLTIVIHNASPGDIAQANQAMADTVATYNSQIGNPSSDSSATGTGTGTGIGAGGSALGNTLRQIPLIGRVLGGAGDIVSGVVGAAAGVLSFGQLGTFGNGLSNIGHGLAGAAMGGLDLVGKAWNAPNTAIGLVWGGVGVLLGADISISHNAIQFMNHPLMFGAITLGNTISYSKKLGPDSYQSAYGPTTRTGPHEEAHTYQSQVFGPLFLPFYFLNGGVSKENPFEKAANDHALDKGGWFPSIQK